LGPKKIKALYQKLGIKTLEDLEKAAKKGTIAKLSGFGKKSEENILKGISFVKGSGGRFLLGNVLPEIRMIEERLRSLKIVSEVVVAGSVRRRKETVGDVDILAISKHPKAVMDFFTSMKEVSRVYAEGETKSMILLRSGLRADLRVVLKESYGAALNYFTGSKDHNVELRKIALSYGYTLNEYGLYRKTRTGKGEHIAGETEEELYRALSMDYIEPELRERTGEIEAAQKGKLPKLVGYKDLKGDLQTQTSWTDGADNIEAMAYAAMDYGLHYIVITDHTKRLAMTHGLDAKRIIEQMKEIDNLNSKFKVRSLKFQVLKGTECDILRDGSLDLPDDILKKLDVVGISVHSLFNLPRKEQTERMVRAMKNPHADILFHPTGRLINRRKAYDVDMDEIIRTAKETGTILEIDAHPERLDLQDENIRKCVEQGVRMSIDSDAHAKDQFSVLEFGIAQARRGWATRADIINTLPVEQMLASLK